MVFGRVRDQQKPDHKAIEARADEEMHGLVTQLTNEITFHMRECGLSRAELAARMGVSPGRISQILGGGENLTLRTLAALATALDARFDFELNSLKTPDEYTDRGAAETPPTANHHALPRAKHSENATSRAPRRR
jgi:transcriptional regulator with XRE-family HTH domain